MKKRAVIISVLALVALLLLWLWLRDVPSARNQPSVAAGEASAPATAQSPNNRSMPADAVTGTKDRLAFARDLMEKANRPIQFFGKVIDQDNNPIPGVRVTLEIRISKELAPNIIQDVFDRPVLTTDADGRFTLTDAKGALLGVHALEKAGYEPSEKAFRKSYWYWRDPSQVFHPNADRPEIFRMWRKSGAEKLVSQDRMTRIPYDGRVVTFELLTGRETAGGGDFRVALVRNPQQVKWGQRNYEWTLTIESVDGGLIASSDEQMYRAPADGYQARLVIHMPADDPQWTDDKSVEFYLKSQGGKHYSRVKLSVMVGSEKPTTGLSFHAFINPSGSRNLEYDPLQNVAKPTTPKPDEPKIRQVLIRD